MEHKTTEKISNSQVLQQLTKFQEFFVRYQEKLWLPNVTALRIYIIASIVLSTYLALISPLSTAIYIPFLSLSQSSFTIILVVLLMFFVYMLRAILYFVIGGKKIMRLKGGEYVLFEGALTAILLPLILLALKILKLSSFDIIKFEIAAGYIVIFIVVNLYLLRERFKFLSSYLAREHTHSTQNKFVSLRFKYILSILFIILIVSAIIFLSNYKFIPVLRTGKISAVTINPILKHIGLLRLIALENLLVFVLVAVTLIIVVYTYGTNLRLMFSILNNAVFQIIMGDYTSEFNRTSNDELGLCSEIMQSVTREVKARERIISIFGKYVAPSIAEDIIQGAAPLKDGGDKREIVNLHICIKNFESVLSKYSAKAAVQQVNKFYADVEKLLEKRTGILDKISGDVCVGMFGLSGIQKGINNAIYAASDIHRHFSRIMSKFNMYFEITIGNVIVGLLGTSNKYELTALDKSSRNSTKFHNLAKQHHVDLFIDSHCYKFLTLKLKELAWKKYNIKVNSGTQIHIFGVKFSK